MASNRFIDIATQIVLDNLSNEQFGVESLAESCSISRSQLLKRIKKNTGKTASQFIREIRLDEALRQLQTGEKTVSQVAYDVGFSSHAYFTTCFKEYFGYAPSEVSEQPQILQDEDIKGSGTLKATQFRLKWIAASAVIITLITLGVFALKPRVEQPINKEKTIAVIRFDNMTNDETVTPFTDGLGEEIINSLSKVDQLRVTARNSSFVFNKDDDINEIRKILNVNYLLEGSVRKNDDKYRITVQLIDATDGFHLWSENYDRTSSDVLFLQEEIARIVAQKLRIQLTDKEDEALSSRITEDSTAYQLYHESLKTAASNNIKDIKKGLELMKKAIAIDSNFALAHAKIVRLYSSDNFVGETEFKDALKQMEWHVKKAFQLDPQLAEAYMAEGLLKELQKNRLEALKAFNKAVELAPNNPLTHFEQSRILRRLNRTKEGYEAWLRAFELDPLDPRMSIMLAQYFYFVERDFNKGITTLENSIDAFPDNDLAEAHLQYYEASLPDGDLVSAFKNYFELYQRNPEGRREMNWLFVISTWLDMKPLAEVLNNQMRLNYPTNIHTFWNMYKSNGLHSRFAENIDLVNFWSKDQGLDILIKTDYLADSYINLNQAERAILVIRDSIPNIDEEIFLSNSNKNFDLPNIRLQLMEKYIIAQRAAGNHIKADSLVRFTINYIDSELKRLSNDNILDYRQELFLKLIRASVTDDPKKLVALLEKTYFNDKHRVWIYDELVTNSRYYPYRNNPQFQTFFKTISKAIHQDRSEVILFLKQNDFWESSWDDRL